MSDNPSPENSKAFNAAKAAVDAEVEKLKPATPGLVFKTQLAAVDRLNALGFKCGKSKFNADVKAKRIATNPEGHFEDYALQAYAVAQQLTPLARAEHGASVNATAQKLTADARLKEIQAQRQEHKFGVEQGLYMLKADHESSLGARALFFKSEIEGFGLRAMPALIQLVGGREDSLAEALAWWEEQTADLMDAWSRDREFTTGDEEDGQASATGEEPLSDFDTDNVQGD